MIKTVQKSFGFECSDHTPGKHQIRTFKHLQRLANTVAYLQGLLTGTAAPVLVKWFSKCRKGANEMLWISILTRLPLICTGQFECHTLENLILYFSGVRGRVGLCKKEHVKK